LDPEKHLPQTDNHHPLGQISPCARERAISAAGGRKGCGNCDFEMRPSAKFRWDVMKGGKKQPEIQSDREPNEAAGEAE